MSVYQIVVTQRSLFCCLIILLTYFISQLLICFYNFFNADTYPMYTLYYIFSTHSILSKFLLNWIYHCAVSLIKLLNVAHIHPIFACIIYNVLESVLWQKLSVHLCCWNRVFFLSTISFLGLVFGFVFISYNL